jgi:chromosome segregation ATPase
MTDNEIIKALECCAGNTEEKCRECPFHKLKISCIDGLERNALDLINRQKAEIEELRKAKVVYETVDYSSGDLEDALEEIDRLKIENDSLRTAGNSLKMHLKKAKEEIEGLKNKIEHLVCFLVEVRIDAIKEFAERLKNNSEYGSVNVSPWQIDNLVKEMTGKEDPKSGKQKKDH